jgi:hypothetical protein
MKASQRIRLWLIQDRCMRPFDVNIAQVTGKNQWLIIARNRTAEQSMCS